ncbi:MAG: ChbG/HpnK family deacetylase [Halioglobus sp.]|nr:ChbG/HpnK family deacetylase [Halioglobus sp.]
MLACVQRHRSTTLAGRALCLCEKVYKAAALETLIVNADDFGLATSVNDAIIDTFNGGIVTSTTLITNAEATKDAIKKAKEHPKLGVGLHFNITLGRPVSDTHKVRSLVDKNGVFLSRDFMALKLLLGLIPASDLTSELLAQYEYMVSHGLHPTHIDSHQHIHAMPLCFDVIASLCKEKGIPIRMPWPLGLKGIRVPFNRWIRQSVLSRLLSRNENAWTGEVLWNAGLGSIFDLGIVPTRLSVSHYRKLLCAAPHGPFELMVHPARRADQLVGKTRIGDISVMEWQFLMSGDLHAVISELNFILGDYRNL